MLPERYNRKKEKRLRVCDACQRRSDTFRHGLLQGSIETVAAAYRSGTVVLDCPNVIFPDRFYPVHCAVRGGSLDLLQWLTEDNGVSLKVTDADGLTPLGIACNMKRLDMMQWMVAVKRAKASEITSLAVLQAGLQTALESPLLASALDPGAAQPGASGSLVEAEAQQMEALRDSMPAMDDTEPPAYDEGDYAAPPDPTCARSEPAPAVPAPASAAATATAAAAAADEASSNPFLEEAEAEEASRTAVPPESASVASDDGVHLIQDPPGVVEEEEDRDGSEAGSLDNECSVCFEAEVDSVLVPCGHCCTCEACGKKLSECPICRQAISQVIRTYGRGGS